MNSRRNFIKKSSLITLGALNYNFSPVIKDINGVDISVITYSFNPGPEDMNVIIQNCIDSGSDNLELMGNHVERSIGMPRSRRMSADWRSNVSMKLFKDAKKVFKDNGINIFAFKPNCIGKNNTDEEIEYAMKATKSLGADFLTNELMDNDSVDRVNFYAEKNNVNISYHTHANNLGSNVKTTDTAWDYAINSSKKKTILRPAPSPRSCAFCSADALRNEICHAHLKFRSQTRIDWSDIPERTNNNTEIAAGVNGDASTMPE